MNKDFSIYYNGVPFKPKYNGIKMNWRNLFQYILSLDDEGFLYIDGWRFKPSYGLVYLRENKEWSYYLPPDGVKDKSILDIGGGCGETAKFFLEKGAIWVDIIDSNEECRESLDYNSKYHDIRSWIKKFNIEDIYYDYYDLIKMDIEGYEIELIPYLDKIKIDMVLEAHTQYIIDKFLEKGFKFVNKIKEYDPIIHGIVASLYRWV